MTARFIRASGGLENEITKRRDAFGNRIAAAEHEQSEAAPYTRTVWVYVPAQYVPGTAAPFIVVQDGYHYVNRVPRVLDNLIAAKRVPVMVAVLGRQRRRRCARVAARVGVRHAVGAL